MLAQIYKTYRKRSGMDICGLSEDVSFLFEPVAVM
jgi:hypothetical protein